MVAQKDATVVGLCEASIESVCDHSHYRDRIYAVVWQLVVKKTEQRQGIGSALLESTIQWARERGRQQVELSVSENNHAAIELYESAGFRAYKRMLVKFIE